MTPEQAIEVLLKAASMALLNKQDHIVCEKAAQVLKEALASLPAQAAEKVPAVSQAQ